MDEELGRLRIEFLKEAPVPVSFQPSSHDKHPDEMYWSVISRHAKDDGRAAAEAVFQKCGINHNGGITLEKIKNVLNETSSLAEDEIQDLFRAADKNGNGVIEHEELRDFLFMESSDHLVTRAVLIDWGCGGSLAKSGTSTTSRGSLYWIVDIFKKGASCDILLADEGGKELGWVDLTYRRTQPPSYRVVPADSQNGENELSKCAINADARRRRVSEAQGRASLKAAGIDLEALSDMSMSELSRLWRSHGLKPHSSRDDFIKAAKDIFQGLVVQVAYDPDADAVVCAGLVGDQVASIQGDFHEMTGWEMLVSLAEQRETTPSMLQLLLPSGRLFVKADHDVKVSALFGVEIK